MKQDELKEDIELSCLNSLQRFFDLNVDEVRNGMLNPKTEREWVHKYNFYHDSAKVAVEALKVLLK